MFKDTYASELEAMRDFYEELGMGIPDYSCSTDGMLMGTLFELKLDKNTHNDTFDKQVKRYIRSLNSAAHDLPSVAIVATINKGNGKGRKYTVYGIETTADGKIKGNLIKTGLWETPTDLKKFIDGEFSRGWIDQESLVAYNVKFYEETKALSKSDYIKELGETKNLFIHPYRWNEKGDMERSMLDCIGSDELKRRLGAFFTPDPYVEISTKYLRNAIADIQSRMKKGEFDDYVIIDRCSGSGNLEKFLNDEELSHCILNTYVFAEWTTLRGVFGTDETGMNGRVRMIIPHTAESKGVDGLLSDGDALAEPFYNPMMHKPAVSKMWEYVNNPRCAVIMLENPPYSAVGSKYQQKSDGTSNKYGIVYIKEEMKKDANVSGQASNDMANQFIWSAWSKFHPEHYIVLSPVKYCKVHNLVNRKLAEGHLANRKEFHASEGCIGIMHWLKDSEEWETLDVTSDIGNRTIRRVRQGLRKITPAEPKQNPMFDDTTYQPLGYYVSCDGTPNYLHGSLGNSVCKHDETRIRTMTETNLLVFAPLYACNFFPSRDYTDIDNIWKSGDGGDAYTKDKDFLNDCLFWACITADNKCKSDKKLRNELCLNQDTEADKLFAPKKKHHKILNMWQKLLEEIAKTDEFNPKYTYGLDQICKEIDIKEPSGNHNKKGEPIMQSKNPEVTEQVKNLKAAIKEFYQEHITEKLFKYELLK
jgi:hypothetical protein